MFEINKILVPLDGSPLAEAVLSAAVSLAKAVDAPLLLLHVIESVIPLADEELYVQVKKLQHSEAKHYMAQVAQMPLLASVSYDTLISEGTVFEAIVETAVNHSVDLIMMSSHGRSGISRLVYGSVAETVLRLAPCATIVLHSKCDIEMFSRGKILVTLDGSELAEKAIQPAKEIALAMSADLVLLRVINAPYLAVEFIDPVGIQQNLDKFEAQERIEATRYLEETRQKIATDNLNVELEILNGATAELILAYAEHNSVDLIAMCSHGRSGISRWFYGSVAERVLHGSHCATMITRG